MIKGLLLCFSISLFIATVLLIGASATGGILANPITGNVTGDGGRNSILVIFLLFSFIASAILLLNILRPKKRNVYIYGEDY